MIIFLLILILIAVISKEAAAIIIAFLFSSLLFLIGFGIVISIMGILFYFIYENLAFFKDLFLIIISLFSIFLSYTLMSENEKMKTKKDFIIPFLITSEIFFAGIFYTFLENLMLSICLASLIPFFITIYFSEDTKEEEANNWVE